MPLTQSLHVASRALDLFSSGIQVASNNIANASTPGYVRDELRLQTATPVRNGQLVFGTGADPAGVRQQLDKYLESRIHSANSDFGAASARNQTYEALQTALNELGDRDVSSSLNRFFDGLSKVANQPDDPSQRLIAVNQGEQFARDVSQLRLRLDELRHSESGRAEALVVEANQLLESISRLNPQIRNLEYSGLDPNDAGALRIDRLNALQRLAEIIPIRSQEAADGGVAVYLGNDYLILDGAEQRLETYAAADLSQTVTRVRLSKSNFEVTGGGGELAGVIEGRDQVLGGFIRSLDTLIGGFVHEFNRVHSSGEGLLGYANVTAFEAVDNPAAALDGAGLAFTPTHGSFQVKLVNKASGLATTANINITLDGIGTSTTLNGLASSLDGLANLSATVNSQGRLNIAADAGYEVRFANDTSGVLASLGINTFFTGSDSSNIGINSVVKADSRFLATGRGNGPADGSNVTLLAQTSSKNLDSLGGVSVDTYYTQTVAALAQGAAGEATLRDGFESFRDSLATQREQNSGVSLDEETIRVLQLQRGYQAAARIITTVDELFNTLLQI